MGCGAGYTFRISHYITLDTSGPPLRPEIFHPSPASFRATAVRIAQDGSGTSQLEG